MIQVKECVCYAKTSQYWSLSKSVIFQHYVGEVTRREGRVEWILCQGKIESIANFGNPDESHFWLC